MNRYQFNTPITIKRYCEDYIGFANRNRIVAFEALQQGLESCAPVDRLLITGKLLHEYGASIEEFFVYAYAVYEQCNIEMVNVDNDEASDAPGDDQIFFRCVFEYSNNRLRKFIEEHDFSENPWDLFKLPQPHLVARNYGLDAETVISEVQKLGNLLNDLKKEFYHRPSKSIYNKLKHPFLVLSPASTPDDSEEVLPVLNRRDQDADPRQIGTVQPVKADSNEIAKWKQAVLNISTGTRLLLQLMVYKFDIDYPNSEF